MAESGSSVGDVLVLLDVSDEHSILSSDGKT
jgi:hypothetical protein